MANNTAVTAGSGTLIGTDDVAGVHYQKVKLAAGVEDSAVMIGHLEDTGHTTGDAGLMALAVRNDVPVALAGTDLDYVPLSADALGRLWNHGVGEYGSFALTPTVDTAIYAAGDIVGGILTIANWAKVTGGAAKLRALNTWTEDGELFAYTMLFFNATPSGGTYTDNLAPVWNAADFAKFIGKITVAAGDYVTSGADGLGTTTAELVLPVAATSLFALIIATATPTFAAATDLNLMLVAEY